MQSTSPTKGRPQAYSTQDLEMGVVSKGESSAQESKPLLSMGVPPRREGGKPKLRIEIPRSNEVSRIYMLDTRGVLGQRVPDTPKPGEAVAAPHWSVVPRTVRAVAQPNIHVSEDKRVETPMERNGLTWFSYTDTDDAPSATPESQTVADIPAPMATSFKYESRHQVHRPPVRHEGSGGKLDCAPHVVGRAGFTVALGGAAALLVGGLQQAGVLEGGDEGGQSAALFGGGVVALTVGLRCVYHFCKCRQPTA
jgi:hypothetical protein